MKIATVVANGYKTSLISPLDLRKIGAVWGALEAYNNWKADNVVCYNNEAARIAVNLGINKDAYFFAHQSNFAALGKLPRVHYFGGEFPTAFTRPDEVVAMNLAGAYFDLVILLGVDLGGGRDIEKANYINAVKSAITQNPNTQWVAVPITNSFSAEFNSLDNFTTDNIDSVLSLANG